VLVLAPAWIQRTANLLQDALKGASDQRTGTCPFDARRIALCGARALRSGASGYITKLESADKVLLAIRRVLAGEVYLSGTLTSAFLKGLTARLKTASDTTYL
jgi:hypothetical protein